MPIQDESLTPTQEDIRKESVKSNVVTTAEDCMLDEGDDNMSITIESQPSDAFHTGALGMLSRKCDQLTIILPGQASDG